MPDPAAGRIETLYQSLLDSIPSSVLLVDRRLHIISANRNFLQKSRLEESRVINQPLEAVFPAPMYEHMGLTQRIHGVFHTGEGSKGKRMTYRAPGLGRRTYYYSLVPVAWNGTVEHVMLLMEDVTEQVRLGEEIRRAERHLASIVESASDIIVSTDLDGRVLTWNPAAERITGFREADVQGRPLPDLCRKRRRAAMAKILNRARSEGRTGPVEMELIDARRKAVPISWVCSAMQDADGQIVGGVAVGRDLTERRGFEARLIQSEKLAALGVMAGGIAHEIRNPLAVVSSAAQLLLETRLSKDVLRECAEKIHQAAIRASSIIERLLRFSRPSDKVAMTRVDLVRVVEEALALVANQACLQKIQLRRRFPDHPVHMRGNTGLVQQLVMNLVLNAANAIPARGGTVEVSAEEGDSQVQLRVADTGKGIRPADLPKVFDPFFTTMPAGKGSGLGLSICYAIVRQHGGTIDVVSHPKAGATVTVVFPRGRKR